LPSTHAIPDRDVFYVADPISSIPNRVPGFPSHTQGLGDSRRKGRRGDRLMMSSTSTMSMLAGSDRHYDSENIPANARIHVASLTRGSGLAYKKKLNFPERHGSKHS
jgi:hypothetical protein